MSGFSRKMGDKASQGNYDFKSYTYEYQSMSPEEQEQLMEEVRRKLRKAAIFGIVMIVILPFLTRRNHRYYILDHGELVPVEFEGGMRGGMMPNANNMGPFGQAPYPQDLPPQQYQQQYQQPQYQNTPRPYGLAPGYQSPYNTQQTQYQSQPPQYKPSNYQTGLSPQ